MKLDGLEYWKVKAQMLEIELKQKQILNDYNQLQNSKIALLGKLGLNIHSTYKFDDVTLEITDANQRNEA
jgi:hypothetical protein